MPSSSPSQTDTELLSRLNALKESQISFDSSSAPKLSQPDDLAARFLNFHANRKPAEPTTQRASTNVAVADEGRGNGQDDVDLDEDKTIEELLADIGPEDQSTLLPQDPKRITQLLDEAKGALAAEDVSNTASQKPQDVAEVQEKPSSMTVQERSRSAEEDGENHGSPTARDLTHDDPDNEQTADADAEAYIQQVLDELALEGGDDASSGPRTPKEATPKQALSSNQDEQPSNSDPPPLELPSTPSSLPLAPSSPPQSNAAKDAGGLQLPSAPTAAPIRRSPKTKSNLPTYTDAEINTWCVICNDDATISCIGCDGDLYCAKCWREGHVGPDVGFEERGHRWAKYVKPR